jgi:hypothetical protein
MTDDGIDFGQAAQILEKIAPVLTGLERDVQRELPDLGAEAVSDAALARALARLHSQLNRDTTEYLAWKTRQILADSRRLVECSRTAQAARAGRSGSTPMGTTRSYVDAQGDLWNAFEVASTSTHPERGPALVFSSEMTWRRVHTYPANWCTLSDEELVQLSWQR